MITYPGTKVPIMYQNYKLSVFLCTLNADKYGFSGLNFIGDHWNNASHEDQILVTTYFKGRYLCQSNSQVKCFSTL